MIVQRGTSKYNKNKLKCSRDQAQFTHEMTNGRNRNEIQLLTVTLAKTT